MADSISVDLCARARETLHFDVTEVIVPGADGVFTVRPGHTALLSTLIPGVVLAYMNNSGEQHFAVSGGFAEVKDDHVLILSDAFEAGDEIDVARAEAAHERAESRLRKPGEDTDLARAEASLNRATARLSAQAKKYVSRGPARNP
ncbi:MAG: ATP synthase F1 subunit epsilon [Nitrospiraceae bacterium]|nr:ATP synthase F1 subunit epsilon [Nitrospiraceae bacterium]